MKMVTSIPVRKETRDKLRRYGYKGETYDEVINRILEHVLPRRPSSFEELKRTRREKYVPLEEVLETLGL